MDRLIASVPRPNGEEIQARLSDYKGVTYLSIRAYYEDRSSGEMKPGRNGINIPLSEAPEFFRLTEELAEQPEVQDVLLTAAAGIESEGGE